MSIENWQEEQKPLDLSRFGADRIKALGITSATVTVVRPGGEAWQRRFDSDDWQRIESAYEDLRPKKPKILAITPFHPSYGIRPQSWQSIHDAIMAYDGPIDWIISHNDNPHEVGFANVTYQHNKARAVALAGDYDAMVSIEADMIVPADTIQKLLDTEADIAYGLYVWRYDARRWNTYHTVDLFGGWSISVDPEKAKAAWGTVQDVAGLGMGCTLIRRNVLEQTDFRLYDGREDWISNRVIDASNRAGLTIDPFRPRLGMFCDDWLLAIIAQHHGFSQRADLSLVCGHIDGERVFWPDPTAKELYREETIGD